MSKNLPEIFSTIDWSALSSGLVVLGSALLLSLLLALGSQQYHRYTKDWELKMRNVFGSVNAEYSQVQDALTIVNTFYFKEFKALAGKDGFFKESYPPDMKEQQLIAIEEKIESLLVTLKLPFGRVSSKLGSKKNLLPGNEPGVYTTPHVPIVSPLKVYETLLVLELGLLHEGDLLRLLKSIEFQDITSSKGTAQAVSGLLNLENCTLERLEEEIDTTTVKAHLNAECTLAWYVATLEK